MCGGRLGGGRERDRKGRQVEFKGEFKGGEARQCDAMSSTTSPTAAGKSRRLSAASTISSPVVDSRSVTMSSTAPSVDVCAFMFQLAYFGRETTPKTAAC